MQIVTRTPRTVTVKMSNASWKRLLELERADGVTKAEKKAKKPYRHESLCGMFHSDATEEQLVEGYLQEKYNL